MIELTDLEITRLCAQAMGIAAVHYQDSDNDCLILPNFRDTVEGFKYDPLQDDAQCMALVKRLEMRIQEPECKGSKDRRWRVTVWEPHKQVTQDNDLNRAICLCVARMQERAAK